MDYMDYTPNIHAEMMAEMRWRRDTEYKLLTIYFATSGGAIALLMASLSKDSRLISFLTSLFVMVISVFLETKMTAKIEQENIRYQELGKVVCEIRKRWGMFTAGDGKTRLLPEEMEEFGTGKGFEHTIHLLRWFCAATVAFALIVLLYSLPWICILNFLSEFSHGCCTSSL